MRCLLNIKHRFLKNIGLAKSMEPRELPLQDYLNADFKKLTRIELIKILETIIPIIDVSVRETFRLKESGAVLKRELLNVKIDLKRAQKKSKINTL